MEMAVTAKWFGQAIMQAFGSGTLGNNPNIDFLSDTIKAMLCTSSYAPDQSAHVFKSSVTNEVTGTGYTAGGATLGSKTLTYTAANSWSTQWTASTAFAAGAIVRPTTGNGYLYRAQAAGTTSSSQPSWPTAIGATVVDGGVTWTCVSYGIITFDAADVSWANATITARYAVIYDDTPSTDATKPLLGYVDFGADVTATNGTFAITWDSAGILAILPA
jgi:hypothetical protein